MARKSKSMLGDYVETALSTSPKAHAKRILWAGKELGNTNLRQKRSMEEGVDIQKTVRAKPKKKL